LRFYGAAADGAIQHKRQNLSHREARRRRFGLFDAEFKGVFMQRYFAILAFGLMLCSPSIAAEDPFVGGAVYGDTDGDGLLSTLTVTRGSGGTQTIAESITLKIPKGIFNCDLVLNWKDHASVPAGYNGEFLPRTFDSCSWRPNICGISECSADTVDLHPGKYTQPSRSQLCAEYKTGNGDSVSPKRCFKYMSGADKKFYPQGGAVITIFPTK
jgi:hypothetical protein